MKTYKCEDITKKYICTVLRTMDSTKIFKLVHRIYGGKIDKHMVQVFIERNAPTQKIKKMSWELARLYCYDRHYYPEQVAKSIEFYQANIKHEVINYLKTQIKDVDSPYAKRPMMGFTHLYFCSPLYGHQDYNKWQAMTIAGNDKFCETVIKFADKYFN